MASPCQCRSTHWIKDLQCQGTIGHEGDHWAYDPSGAYCWWVNRRKKKKFKKFDAVAGWVPAGHPTWIHPFDKHEEHHATIYGKKLRAEIEAKENKKKQKE